MNQSARPDDRRAVFLVFGAQHSGTTLLLKFLAMHPDLAWFSQWSQRDGRFPERRRIFGARPVDRMLRRFFRFSWEKVDRVGLQRYLPADPGEEETIWRPLVLGPESIEERARATRAVVCEEIARQRKRGFVGKWPEFSDHLDVLAAAFPEGMFVHAVRDGRAVAGSLAPKLARGQQLSEDRATMEGVRVWQRVLRQADAVRDRVEVVDVRYDDLCHDVHSVMRTLLERGGLDVDRYPFGRCPRVLTSTDDKRLAAIPPELVASIEREIGDDLARFGFADA